MSFPGLNELIAGGPCPEPAVSVDPARLTEVMEEMWRAVQQYSGKPPEWIIIPLDKRVVVRRRGKKFTYFQLSNWARQLLKTACAAGLRCSLSP